MFSPFALGILAPLIAGQAGAAAHAPAIHGAADMATALPGREMDARVAAIAFRLATAGLARCPEPDADPGLTLQHLSQFELSDRPGIVAQWPLDRGPGVIAVVPDGPAARAGIRPGDIMVAVDGRPLPPEPGLSEPFDSARAHARADVIRDLLASPRALSMTLWRDGAVRDVAVTPRPACPARVHLARSDQRNAYADGRHVLLTTGLLARLRGDDELAFLIAHEMAHNILHHAAIMRGDTVAHGIGRTFGDSGRTIRAIERAADALGAELMLDAGFDPVAGVAVLKRLGGADFGIALFATHEPVGRRIAAIRALAAARGAPGRGRR